MSDKTTLQKLDEVVTYIDRKCGGDNVNICGVYFALRNALESLRPDLACPKCGGKRPYPEGYGATAREVSCPFCDDGSYRSYAYEQIRKLTMTCDADSAQMAEYRKNIDAFVGQLSALRAEVEKMKPVYDQYIIQYTEFQNRKGEEPIACPPEKSDSEKEKK